MATSVAKVTNLAPGATSPAQQIDIPAPNDTIAVTTFDSNDLEWTITGTNHKGKPETFLSGLLPAHVQTAKPRFRVKEGTKLTVTAKNVGSAALSGSLAVNQTDETLP